MDKDEYGIVYHSELDLFQALYENPNLDISKFNVTDPETFNKSANTLYSDGPRLQSIEKPSFLEIDKKLSKSWKKIENPFFWRQKTWPKSWKKVEKIKKKLPKVFQLFFNFLDFAKSTLVNGFECPNRRDRFHPKITEMKDILANFGQVPRKYAVAYLPTYVRTYRYVRTYVGT